MTGYLRGLTDGQLLQWPTESLPVSYGHLYKRGWKTKREKKRGGEGTGVDLPSESQNKIDYLQVSVITNCHISPFTLLNVGCLHAMITSVYSVVGATMNTKLTADAEQLKGQGGKKERGGDSDDEGWFSTLLGSSAGHGK